MNVVLIGFSGSGKSTVGRAVAASLGWEFVDTDQEVERVSGRRISEIFAGSGEAVFRELERQAVTRALEGEQRIVAVGGGAVVDPGNRLTMAKGALVVLLEARAETLHRRLAAQAGSEPRPMIMGADQRARIVDLKAARDPVYVAAADAVVRTDGLDAAQVAERVRALVRDATTAGFSRTTDAVGE